MSKASDLIGDLRDDGKLAARGEFQLDREKAREKMQRFQLVDPYHYVLEFIAVAHLLGASTIDIELDADEFELRHDGASLTPEELENVYGAAFQKRPDDRDQALRHLAIGLTAADALDPSVVEIESGRGEETYVFRRDAQGESVEPLDAPSEVDDNTSTRIYLRETFRGSHILKFFQRIASALPEEDLIRNQCRYSRVHIALNGERVSRGFHLPDGLVRHLRFKNRHERGILGFWRTDVTASEPATHVTICQNGVVVTEVEREGTLVPFRAVVESDRLTKNLSQSAFVEDRNWNALFQDTLPYILQRAVHQYIDSLSERERLAGHRWLRHLARELFEQVVLHRRAIARTRETTRALTQFLEELRIWPLADRGSDDLDLPDEHRLVSLRQLVGSGTDRPIYASTERFVEQYEPNLSPVLFVGKDPEIANLLGKYTRRGHEMVTDRLQANVTREINRGRWEENVTGRPDQRAFPWQFSVDAKTASGSIEGIIAFRHNPRMAPAEVVLVKEQGLLHRYQPELELPGIRLELRGDLRVNHLFDDVRLSDADYQESCRKMVAAFPEAVENYVSDREPMELVDDPVVRGYLGQAMQGTLHADLFSALRVPRSVADDFFAKRAGEHAWRLDAGVPEPGSDIPNAPDVDTLMEGLGSIADVPFFTDRRRQRLSIRQLHARYREAGRVFYLRDARVLAHHSDRLDRLAGQAPVVVCDRLGEWLLSRFCPIAANPREKLEYMAHEDRYLARPKRRARLEGGGFLFRKTFEGDGYEGEVGIWPEDGKRNFDGTTFGGRTSIGEVTINGKRYAGQNSMTFLYRERFLASRQVHDIPVGHFEAIVASDALEPTANFKDVVDDETVRRLGTRALEAAEEGLTQWLREAGRRVRRINAIQHRFLWSCLRTATSSYEPDELRSIPMIPVYGGGVKSLVELFHYYEGDEYYWVRSGDDVMPQLSGEEAAWVVELREPDHALEVLESLLGGKEPVDVSTFTGDPSLVRSAEAEFMQRPEFRFDGPPALSRAQTTGTGGTITVRFLGPHVGERGSIMVKWLYRKRLVEETEIRIPFGSYTAVVESPDLSVSKDYDEIASGITGALVVKVRATAEKALTDWLHAYVDREREWQRYHRDTVLQAVRDTDGEVFDAAAAIPIFQTVEGNRLSLRDLSELDVGDTPIRWVSVDTLVDAPRDVRRAVLRLSDADRDVLNEVLDVTLRLFEGTGEFTGFDDNSDAHSEPGASETQIGSAAKTESVRNEEERILQFVRQMLDDVRGGDHYLLGDLHLHALELGEADGSLVEDGYRIDPQHELFRYATHAQDPIAIAFVGSVTYSAINDVDEHVTDDHELEFLDRFARHVASIG